MNQNSGFGGCFSGTMGILAALLVFVALVVGGCAILAGGCAFLVGGARHAAQDAAEQAEAQQAVEASPEKPSPEPRTWRDASGKFSIEGSFEAVEEGRVVLRKPDGTRTRIALDKLSEGDRAWVKRHEPPR